MDTEAERRAKVLAAKKKLKQFQSQKRGQTSSATKVEEEKQSDLVPQQEITVAAGSLAGDASEWQARLDTLRKEYESTVNTLSADHQAAKVQWEQTLKEIQGRADDATKQQQALQVSLEEERSSTTHLRRRLQEVVETNISEMNKIRQRITSLEAELGTERIHLAEERSEREQVQEQLRALRSTTTDEGSTPHPDAEAKINQALAERSEALSQVEELTRQLQESKERYESETSTIRSELAALHEQHQTACDALKDHQQAFDACKMQGEESQARIDTILEEKIALETQLEQAQKEMVEEKQRQTDKVSLVKQDLEKATQLNEELRARVDQLEVQLSESQQSAETLQATLDKSSPSEIHTSVDDEKEAAKIDELTATIQRLEDDLQKERESVVKADEEHMRSLQTLEKEKAALTDEAASLKEEQETSRRALAESEEQHQREMYQIREELASAKSTEAQDPSESIEKNQEIVGNDTPEFESIHHWRRQFAETKRMLDHSHKTVAQLRQQVTQLSEELDSARQTENNSPSPEEPSTTDTLSDPDQLVRELASLRTKNAEMKGRLDRQFDAFTTIRGELSTVRERELSAEQKLRSDIHQLTGEIQRLRVSRNDRDQVHQKTERLLERMRRTLDEAQTKLSDRGYSPVSEYLSSDDDEYEFEDEDIVNPPEKGSAIVPDVGRLPPLEKPAFRAFLEIPQCGGCEGEVIEI